jgi:hypothetical protein
MTNPGGGALFLRPYSSPWNIVYAITPTDATTAMAAISIPQLLMTISTQVVPRSTPVAERCS